MQYKSDALFYENGGLNMYARMYIQYLYEVKNGWKKEGNIGDCIQNIAVENIYNKAGISPNNLTLINRDALNLYNGEPSNLIMQSYFAEAYKVFPFPWSKNILPIFLGFHLNSTNNSRKRFIKEQIHKNMKSYEPVGCRDRSTRDFLKAYGVNAYFSGCMTLTLDARKDIPQNGKIFIVDLHKKVLKNMPKQILEKADRSITHVYKWDKYPLDFKDAMEFESKARDILEIYKKQASLVITSRIHVAMPCIAMGIPVIFISKSVYNVRFDVLQGIVPIYTYKDIKYIDWNPKPAQIAELQNAIAQITKSNTREDALNNLEKVTANLKPIRYLPKYKELFRQIEIQIRKIFD